MFKFKAEYGFQLCYISDPDFPENSKVSRFMMVEYKNKICQEEETECKWQLQGDIDMELAPPTPDSPLGEWTRVRFKKNSEASELGKKLFLRKKHYIECNSFKNFKKTVQCYFLRNFTN